MLRDLLAAPAVARLKGVHQGGASYLVKERRDLSLLHARAITPTEMMAFVKALGVQNGRLSVRGLPEAVWFVQQYHRESRTCSWAR